MNEKELKAKAIELGLPTAEELYLFAERMNQSRLPQDIIEASSTDIDSADYSTLGEYSVNANFLSRCAKGLEKRTRKLQDRKATESNDFTEGSLWVLKNTSPKYLQGVLVQIVEVDSSTKGRTVIWAKIAEATSGGKSLGHTVGYPTSCFEVASDTDKARTPFEEYSNS